MKQKMPFSWARSQITFRGDTGQCSKDSRPSTLERTKAAVLFSVPKMGTVGCSSFVGVKRYLLKNSWWSWKWAKVD